jgi:ABC-type antimicrobial peptide transport system permease subunit
MFLLSIFALLALSLAAIGIYGVISYAVAQRTHEIGVRVALGAQRADVLSLIGRQVLFVTGAGMVAGVAVSLLAGGVLETMLFEITPTDPVTLIGACVVLAAVAVVAAAVPAVRAARLDPVRALRE